MVQASVMDITHLHFREGSKLSQVVHIPVIILLEQWKVNLFFNETFLLFSVLGRQELYVGGQTSDCTLAKQEWLLLLILGSAQFIVRPAIYLVAVILSAHILCNSHEWVNLWELRWAPIPSFLRLCTTHHLLLPLLVCLEWHTKERGACRSTMLGLAVLKIELDRFHALFG